MSVEAAVSRPFIRMPFSSLPALPTVSHPYLSAESRRVMVESKAFGSIGIHVVTYGDPTNPPLMLIHGLMTTGYSFRYVLEGWRWR